MQNLVVKHSSGESYKVLLPRETIPQLNLTPESFWNEGTARQFINNLIVSNNYWRDIVNQCSSSISCLAPDDIEKQVSSLMMHDKIKFYPVKIMDIVDHPPEKRALKLNNVLYRFEPSSSLLFNNVSETKKFNNIDEANEFLSEISSNEEKLTVIAHELSIQLPATASVNKSEIADAISQELVSGSIVIIVDKTSSVPSDNNETNTENGANNKEAGLGTRTEEAITEEEKPPCQLEWVSVDCSHGRTAGITSKTEITPNLDVISTETSESGFDLITAEIHASELCSSHKNNIFGISQPHKFKSKEEKKVQFKVSCNKWDLSNMFERIWLPRVEPKTYNISIKETCEAPDISVKDINVNVYPDIKWHWRTTIDFGKLEFEPGKSKVKYSDFDIDGNVELTYDGKKHDAKEKYKTYIQDPLDGFKKICDTISTVLEVINDPTAALMRIGTQTTKPKPKDGKDNKDGNQTHLIIDWPKLSIDYDSTLIENKSPTYVDHKYNIKLKADPLLEIDIQVDVLQSMISLAPPPVKLVLEYAKERVEGEIKDDQKVGFRGELDIIFTVKTTVNITESEISGTHNISQHDTSVAPVKGDIKIPASLKGVIDAEGKWFILSFKVNYMMKGETEWSGNFEFGSDEKGIYFSNTVEFKGIDITLTKYEEVKAELETEKESTKEVSIDDFYANVGVKSDNVDTSVKLEDGKIEGEVTVKAEENKHWSWLKPKEDEKKKDPIKYYIVKN